jgi:hypothetical protein
MARPLWPQLPASLAYASVELQNVFADDLEAYVQISRNRGIPRGFKVINDPIWFTIRVESWELVVLDSPIIQRLRDIRQLGLAELVYPSAGYSRFELSECYRSPSLVWMKSSCGSRPCFTTWDTVS